MHAVSSWLALLPCAAALTASWQPVPGSVVPPRSGATASTDGASTWLFGGYAEADGERAVVNDLHRLDATATGWTRVRESADGADVPGPRLATASAVLDGEMLLFGGNTLDAVRGTRRKEDGHRRRRFVAVERLCEIEKAPTVRGPHIALVDDDARAILAIGACR